MKVLLINGSPNAEGNTHLALSEVAKALQADGIDTEIVWIGKKPVPGCIACNRCQETGVCVFNSGIYTEIMEKLPDADGIVVGSPTYYAGPTGSLCALLDRVFYSLGRYLQYKPAAAVGVCRRGGSVSTVERLNKYFEMTNMPMPSSQYWNNIYGLMPGDVARDDEGMQTMRTLGHNLARLLKALENVPRPEAEEHAWTHFVR
ncbi:MAG: flavodoxin family protein [Muribaculaceae bacterium]|nr:flavodoxin family protein [Muribaculaceae bacterium]